MPDVLIVGGSIAGATTAIHLRRRGWDVTLIDRAIFPRRKPCGEGLFPRGVAELEELGIFPALRDCSQTLSSLRFTIASQSAEAQIGSPSRPAIGVQREVLDNALIERCREFGTDVRTGAEARRLVDQHGDYGVDVEGAALSPRVVIAADGVRSRLRAQAGLDAPSKAGRYGVAAHMQLLEPPSPRIDVYFERGYEVYVTPAGGSVVNVALLLGREEARHLAGDLKARYLELIGRSAYRAEGELLDEPLAVGPFPVSARRVWRRNLVLVGDAAGATDPINGAGMTLALLTARHCAAAVDAYLRTNTTAPLDAYQQQRHRLARIPGLFARTMLTLSSRPLLGRRAVANLSRHSETFSRLAAINTLESPLSSLRPRDLLALTTGL